MTEILLKVALNTINQPTIIDFWNADTKYGTSTV